MRRFMPVVLLTFTALASAAAHAGDATARKKAPRPGPWWVSLGVNLAHVEDSEQNCPGGQVAIAVGARAFVKLQRTSLSYERSDNTDTCDGLFVGDSSVSENALMLGAVSWNSGLFVAVGPARTRFDQGFQQPTLEDTEVRYELGWSSRHARGSRSSGGVEVVLFANNNDLQHYHGLALNLSFGAGRR